MIRFLFDTDHLTLFEELDPKVMARFFAFPLGEVGTSIVNVYEALRGRINALGSVNLSPKQRVNLHDMLERTLRMLSQLTILPFNQAAENCYQGLTYLRTKVGAQDLKIASIALVHGAMVVTKNTSDFRLIPGLQLDDWSR